MVLAGERGDSLYVKARDLMITALTKAGFKQTDEIWNGLKATYADAVALRRAKTRWAEVKASTTGSRVGAAASEYLMVGGRPESPGIHGNDPKTGAVGVPTVVTSWGVFKGAQVTDGSVAYRQFQQSDNPYDPVFLKNRGGTVSVEPLTPLRSDANKRPAKKPGDGQIPSPIRPHNA